MFSSSSSSSSSRFFSLDEERQLVESLSEVTKFKSTFKNLTLIAHRGMGPTSILGSIFLETVLPENTIRAFKRAMILGADGIELDVFKSSDNQVMVIHDDELCRNVYGVDRKIPPVGETEATYKIGAKTAKELDQLKVGPLDSDKIPTLKEVFDLATETNRIRARQGFDPIILNIEIKDAKAIECCLELITTYIRENPSSGVNFDSICFCSFNHDSLISLKKQALAMHISNIKIAPGIKTATLFGSENVNSDFTVKSGAKYIPSGIAYLKTLVEKNDFTAYDAVLWDIYYPLIRIAEKGRKQLHASTSDHRNYRIPPEQCVFLIAMSENIPVYFKCDEVDRAREILLQHNEPLDWDRKQRLLAQHMAKPTKALTLDKAAMAPNMFLTVQKEIMTEHDATVESRKIAEAQKIIGPRQINGWVIQDVPDDGNCFYLAVVNQLQVIQHNFLQTIPSGTQSNDSLRLQIQGREFQDREWADHGEILEASKKLGIIIAIVDTRQPDRFVYHYTKADSSGDFTTDETSLPKDLPVVKLAYTGSHYLSVRGHPALLNCSSSMAVLTELYTSAASSSSQSSRLLAITKVLESNREIGQKLGPDISGEIRSPLNLSKKAKTDSDRAPTLASSASALSAAPSESVLSQQMTKTEADELHQKLIDAGIESKLITIIPNADDSNFYQVRVTSINQSDIQTARQTIPSAGIKKHFS